MQLDKALRGVAFTKALLAQVNVEALEKGAADQLRDEHGRWASVGGSQGEHDPAPTLSDARYSKGNVAVRAESKDGYKTRAGRLADHVKGNWSNREKAYIMSPSKAVKLKALFESGHDASSFTGELQPPKGK